MAARSVSSNGQKAHRQNIPLGEAVVYDSSVDVLIKSRMMESDAAGLEFLIPAFLADELG